MGKKLGENSKKAAGNAKKAEAANAKAAVDEAKKAAVEDAEWSKGAKSSAKQEAAEAKKAEAARKKAEKDALLAAEEAGARSTPKGANARTAQKKTRGTLDLGQLDDDGDPSSTKAATLNATGIDNALDALSLDSPDAGGSSGGGQSLDRHPERRVKQARNAYEDRRMDELKDESAGVLRRSQRKQKINNEFKKSAENPLQQAKAQFNTTREEMQRIREAERAKTEARLAEK